MATLPSGLEDEILDDEPIARFLTQSSHFNSTITKPSAFLPSRNDRETSVSRHGPEPAERLWKLGEAAAGGRKLYGAAILTAGAVRAASLTLTADEPPDRHAVIRGWPSNDADPDLEKAEQKRLAAMLSSAAGPPLLHR